MTPAAPLIQSAEFAALLRRTGADHAHWGTRLLVTRRVAGLPVTLASRVAIDGAADLAALPPGPTLLNPDHPAPWLADAGAVPLVTPATVAELDLTADTATRRARMHQKWRNRLVRAEGHGLRVTRQPLPADPGHWMLAADRARQRARGYRGWPVVLTLAYAATHPGRAQLFTAHLGREPVAAMLVLLHGQAATYHVGHSTEAGRAHSAQALLLWRASGWLARRGITRLDLGTLDTEAAPGLARFKLGSGAAARALGGTWLWWPPLARGARLVRSLAPNPMDSPAPR